MDPVTGFATARAALETLKALIGLAKEAKNPAINEKVIELQSDLLELQQQLVELHGENATLRTENNTLKEQLTTNRELVFERNAYWRKKEGNAEGPFLPELLGCR